MKHPISRLERLFLTLLCLSLNLAALHIDKVRCSYLTSLVAARPSLCIKCCDMHGRRAGASDDNAERPDASDVPSRPQLSDYAQDQWEVSSAFPLRKHAPDCTSVSFQSTEYLQRCGATACVLVLFWAAPLRVVH